MSDLLAAAAESMGLPEPIVQRSAEARAAETGMTTDEVLSAWAGGKTVTGPSSPATEADEAAETDEAPVSGEEAPEPAPSPTEAPAQPESQPAAMAAPPPAVYPTKPPILVGAGDNPMTIVFAAIGLFIAVFLIGVVGSSVGEEERGARSSEVAYTAAAEDGRQLYASLGCAACHTQMVRPITSDVGLGAVTLSDSNQVLGTRRFGPDLFDVGNRMSRSQIEAVISGFDGHSDAGISSGDLADLVSYLTETSVGAG